MKEYVPSKDLCIELKEAGFPQETEFYHFRIGADNEKNWKVDSLSRFEVHSNIYDEVISAPLTDELLKWLPEKIERKAVIYKLEIRKFNSLFYVQYTCEYFNKDICISDCDKKCLFYESADTLPDALAQMGIYLGEEGLA